ncbi:MAG: GYD domain-containing protein [Candidatus Latescibacteria bacterium]|nr:GYD domain-containing protein [Candidatus Latescibacterota bacterium]
MALYMTQFSYTTESWQAMVKNPQDRTGTLKNLIEKLGGKLIGLHFCFGEFDGFAVYEYPDDVTCVSGVLAVISAGHLKTVKTTKLLTADELVSAMRKANPMVYPGPKG